MALDDTYGRIGDGLIFSSLSILLLDHIDGLIIHLFPTISLLFLTFLLLINFVPYSLKHFPIPLPFYLSTIRNINVTRTLSLHIRFILLFYSYPFTINLIFSLLFCTYFLTQKKVITHSLFHDFFSFFGGFLFLFFVYLL